MYYCFSPNGFGSSFIISRLIIERVRRTCSAAGEWRRVHEVAVRQSWLDHGSVNDGWGRRRRSVSRAVADTRLGRSLAPRRTLTPPSRRRTRDPTRRRVAVLPAWCVRQSSSPCHRPPGRSSATRAAAAARCLSTRQLVVALTPTSPHRCRPVGTWWRHRRQTLWRTGRPLSPPAPAASSDDVRRRRLCRRRLATSWPTDDARQRTVAERPCWRRTQLAARRKTHRPRWWRAAQQLSAVERLATTTLSRETRLQRHVSASWWTARPARCSRTSVASSWVTAEGWWRSLRASALAGRESGARTDERRYRRRRRRRRASSRRTETTAARWTADLHPRRRQRPLLARSSSRQTVC